MNKYWKCESDIRTGKKHRRDKKLCQDNIAYKMLGNRHAISLIDGIGKTNDNAVKGKLVAEMIAEFLVEHYDDIQKVTDEREIAYNLIRHVGDLYKQIEEDDEIQRDELKSTLLGVAIDSKEETYCSIHVGDGVIAVKTEDGNIRKISEPTNGMFINETILSTSARLKDVKVKRGNINGNQGFLLASDGIYNDCFDSNNLEKIFCEGATCDIIQEKDDDQSFIKLYKNRNVSYGKE